MELSIEIGGCAGVRLTRIRLHLDESSPSGLAPQIRRNYSESMSYDLTIRADEKHSRSTPFRELAAIIEGLPNIRPNGEMRFALDDLPRRWMEIDLEVVSEEGDSVAESWRSYDTINCIRLHIPYQFLGKAMERDYLPTAFAIADFVGWPLYDDQTDRFLLKEATASKSWWRFW